MNYDDLLNTAQRSAARATPEALEAADVLIALDAIAQPSEAATAAFAALDAPTRTRYRAGDTFRYGGADYRLERPTVALRQILRCPKTWAQIKPEEAAEWAALGSVETPLGSVPWTVLISFASVAMLALPPGDAADLRYEIETRPGHPKLRALIAAWGRSQESERARAAEELRRPDVSAVHVAAAPRQSGRTITTLDGLILSCLLPDELRRFLAGDESLSSLRDCVAWGNPSTQVAFDVANLLKQYGQTRHFLTLLAEKIPNRATEIRAWITA